MHANDHLGGVTGTNDMINIPSSNKRIPQSSMVSPSKTHIWKRDNSITELIKGKNFYEDWNEDLPKYWNQVQRKVRTGPN